MKYVIIMLFLLLGHNNIFGQSVITITHSDGSTYSATNVQTAINLADPGSIIYLPAGNFNLTGVIVDKQVTIIGAGYNTKLHGSAGITYLTGSITIDEEGSGGSLQGVYISGSIVFGSTFEKSNVKNYVIQRCFATAIFLANKWDGFNSAENILIKECIIDGPLYGGKAKNVVVRNNVLRQTNLLARLITHFENANFHNNIIVPIDNNPFNGIWGCIFENNIITHGNFQYVNAFENNQYLNNLYCHADGLNPHGVVRSEGNVYIEMEKIFKNYKHGPLSFDDDYHLTPEALSAITGTDGTQVGIYGTNDPFKEIPIPQNPHINKAKVNSMTNAKGQLKIEFNVETQTK